MPTAPSRPTSTENISATGRAAERAAIAQSTHQTNLNLRIQELALKKWESSSISPECLCISKKSGIAYDLCYRNGGLVGKPFNCSFLPILEDLKILDNSDLVDLFYPTHSEFLFVSPVSQDHFRFFNKSYNILRKHFPSQKMLVYSLDLTEKEVNILKRDPLITVSSLDYSKYPANLKKIMEYRFKVIIMAEALRQSAHVIWLDAHVQWNNPKPLKTLYEQVHKCHVDPNCQKRSPFLMQIETVHTNFEVLVPGLLDYFPTTAIQLDELKSKEKGRQMSAAFSYTIRTKAAMEIIKWHVLCALEEKCMNPPGARLKCDPYPGWSEYSNCFRYDQSSINLLLFHKFHDFHNYALDMGGVGMGY